MTLTALLAPATPPITDLAECPALWRARGGQFLALEPVQHDKFELTFGQVVAQVGSADQQGVAVASVLLVVREDR